MAEQKALVKAASGRMVSIPVSRLESWKKRQDEIAEDLKAGRKPKLTEEEQKVKDELMTRFLKSKERAQKEKGSQAGQTQS